MAVNIKLKRSAVPGNIPTTSQLELGELALNTYDGRAFFKQQVGIDEYIVELASTGSTVASASYAAYAALAGTASVALNAISSSYALSSSYSATATSASYAISASVSDTTISSSYATSASYAETSSYATNFNVSGNLVVGGDITATTLHVQTVTSSIIYSSGSNVFGDATNDTQTLIGTVNISGSLNVSGSTTINSLTGSLYGTASWALDAVNAINAPRYTLTSSFQNFTQSYYADSASVSTRVTNLEQFSASILNYTASTDAKIASIYNATSSLQSATASLNAFSASILNYTASTDAKIASIYLATASLQSATASLNDFSASILNYTASNNANIASLNLATASLNLATASLNNQTASLLNYTASTDAKITSIYNATASLQSATASLNLATASLNAQTASLLNYTSSTDAKIASIYNATSSLQSATASLNDFSASMLAFTASYSTGSFTGSFNGSFTGSLNNLQGTARHIPFFSSSQLLSDSSIYQVGDSSVAINQNAVTTAAPEALYVWQPSTSSFNVISGKGNLDTYLQLNIQNTNQGTSASSDIVATANNGNENTNYIDMGINSENFSGFLGGPNDAYVYAAGNEFHIGNITPNKHLGFFVGGGDVDAGNKFALYPNNQHQMTGSLDVSGSVKAFSFTGSLLGTASFADNATSSSYAFNATSASYALTASHATNVPVTSSYAISASVAISSSYATDAISASYAVTASSADDFLVRGTLTAQTIIAQVITSSVSFITGSTKFGTITSNTHQFTGSVSVSGSLAVNDSNVILTNQTSSMSVLSASYANNATSASYALTSSFAAIAASGTGSFTGSFRGTVTGSLLGTASYAANANSASFATIASFATSAESADFATSASFASTASFASRGNGIFSGSFSGSFFGSGAGLTNISASSVVGLNLSQIASGSVTASVDPNGFKVNSNATISGSTQITGSLGVTGSVSITGSGTVLSANVDTISFTGSFAQSGSVTVVGGVNATSFTGSLLGTASFAVSASQAQNAVTASYILNAVSASFASTASFVTLAQTASFVTLAQTASFVQLAQTASFASTASSADNFLVRGTLTAQTIIAQTITSSTDFVTGSTKFGTLTSNTHQFTGSVSVSGSLAANGSNVILTNQTSSMSVATASYVENAQTASFVQNAVSSSFASTASFVALAQTASFVTLAQTASFVTTAQTASFVTLAQTASFVQTAQTASYVLNAVSASYASNADLLDGKDSSTFATTGSNTFRGNQTVTGSLFTSGSNTLVGTTTLTGSFLVSGSTTQIGNNTLLGNTTLSGSVTISGSANASANFTLQGHLRLDPGQDPGNNNFTASYLFTSASNTATGYDLYYRQDGNLVKFKWLEGGLSTGVLYGGGISYSGSTIFVKPGAGIINNMNASTGSEINPIITYVNWGPYTASVQNLTSSQNTYLYVDASGSIFQQTSFFDQTQYEQALPLGRVTHPNYVSITGYGSNVQTTYDEDSQQNAFIRAFGPIKVSGFTITPHTGSLSLGIGNGIAFNLGGFYTQDPNSPSHYESAGFATASIARAWRSGSGVYLDNNGGTFYTTVDPDYWDDGTGTLNTMNAGDWQIQRVFANPVTGRTVVYYGQNVYTNLLNALQYLATDSFVEGEFTAKSLVFVGYLVLKGQTNNLTDTANNRIIDAGIFRNIAGGSSGGGAVAQTLEDLSDVIITTPTNYQALVYDGGNWINGTPLNATSASFATTASYAATASFVQNAQTASYVAFAQSASFVSGAVYTTGNQSISGLKTFVNNTAFSSSILMEGSGSNNYMLAFKQPSILNYPGDGYSGVGAFLNNEMRFYFNQGGLNYKDVAFNANNVPNNSTLYLTIPSTGGTLLVSNLLTGSVATASLALTAQTASYVLNAVSASFASTASSADNFLVRGTLTAQTIVAQTITSSIDFVTGSTRFGTLLSNTHQFTGSVSITGSLNSPSITGSLLGTASFANNATSASYALSSSFASTANSASYALSASYAFNATSASYALTASNIEGGATNYLPLWLNNTKLTSSIVYQNATGIGVNDVVPTHKFQVNGDALIYNSNSTLNTNKYALLPTLNITTVGTETNQWANVGIYGSLGFSATASTFTPQDNSFVSVFLGNVVKSGAGNVSGKMSSYAAASNFSGTGNVTTVAGFRAYAPLQSYSLPSFTGTITNYIGLLVDDITGTTDVGSRITNKWGIYQSGSLDKNYFAGATIFAGGFTGSLEGTSSYAVTASYALNAGSGGGGGLSALYIQDEGVTQGTASYIDFTGPGVTATVTGGTASISITGGGDTGEGQSVVHTQASPSTTWTFNHNLNSQYLVYDVYDSNSNAIIPANVSASSANTLVITFGVATAGYAVATVGGGLPFISASFNGYVLTASGSTAAWAPTSSLSVLSASYAATASYVLNAVSASFASTASFVQTAQTASFVTLAQTASFVQNAQTASYVLNAISASHALTASSADNFTVRGTLTAQTIIAQTITSSTDFVTGSTRFGSLLSNTHQFTGSMLVTGSITGSGNVLLGGSTGLRILGNTFDGNSGGWIYSGTSGGGDLVLSVNIDANNVIPNSGTTWGRLNLRAGTFGGSWSTGSFNFTSLETRTSGERPGFQISPSFSPSSGNANYSSILLSPQINTTGTYAGVVRGFVFSPTQTSVVGATIRAIETNIGDVLLGTTSGDVAIGTSTLGTATKLTIGGSETASSAIARGQLLNTALTASANNDVLVGLDINPTFTNGAFTGVTNYGLRVQSGTSIFGGSVILNGNTLFLGAVNGNEVLRKQGNNVQLFNNNSGAILYLNANGSIDFGSNQNAASTWARFFNTGNLLIQNGGTFTDSGFRLDVSGSTRFNGNSIITGSLTVITGSAIEFQVTNTGVKIGNAITDTHTVTGSLNISGSTTATSFTGSLLGTASFANNATSASYALVATTAQTASFSTNFTVASTLTLDATLTDYATVASSIVGSNNLFTQNTGSYTSAFFKYTVSNGANTRAGEVIAAWNGTSTTFTDFSTVDIGDTSAVTSSISIVAGQAQFNIQTNSSGWRLKSIGTFM
jgi:hypothetical protein